MPCSWRDSSSRSRSDSTSSSPPLTIGLAWLLVYVERKAWKTGDPDWERAGRFFAKILGLTFAVGVATGIVMEFQFGTNWAEYSATPRFSATSTPSPPR